MRASGHAPCEPPEKPRRRLQRSPMGLLETGAVIHFALPGPVKIRSGALLERLFGLFLRGRVDEAGA